MWGGHVYASACKCILKNIVSISDYTPAFICSDANQREKTMNEITVGGEAHTEYFKRQMLDIWAEYQLIRYQTPSNCQNYVAWARVRAAG